MNNITTTIFGDEKAWAYQEVHLPKYRKGRRRYKIIFVKRDGKLAEYREDMGNAKNFKGVRQINIPSLFEHTVDELLNLGDELRNETAIDVKDFLQLEKYKV